MGRRPTWLLAPDITPWHKRAIDTFELGRWMPELLSGESCYFVALTPVESAKVGLEADAREVARAFLAHAVEGERVEA
jgi:hypothetical protein